MSAFIARFNPHQMDDETVLALATGRKHALAIALDTLADNREGQGAERQHLLVVGPRGRGKSFFLKYLRIHFERDQRFKNCRFVSLPEEQSNVRYASDFVRMILSQVTGTGYQSVAAYWREPEELWQMAYAELEDWCKTQLALHSDFLLLVVVENFQDLLERLDETGEHRIRHMMEHLPGFVLIGATPFSRVDSDYNRPLFHIFKELQIERWTSEDYVKYFRRRLQNDQSGRVRTSVESRLLEAKLLAISQYTGGSPRMAVVLSNLLLHDNMVGTARTLYGLVDELTPYYQDLTKEIPANSRLLFDALIRLGENLSQSELAAKVGATQNEISKAFRWLQENGYVVGAKRLDSKEFRYNVSDRVYVLYYQQREIFHDKNYTPIWLMADFLMEFFAEEGELKREALVSLIVEPSRDSEDLMRVWMRKKGMKEAQYAQERSSEELLKEMGVGEKDFVSAAAHLVDEGKYDRAIEYSNKLLEETGVYLKYNFYLNWVVGRALAGLRKFEEAIDYHKKSLQLSLKEGHILFQALNFSDIGRNLENLDRYLESIDENLNALKLFELEGNAVMQAWSQERIAWCYKMLGQFPDSIHAHREAIEFRKKTENPEQIAWNLGQIAVNHFLTGYPGQAWAVLNELPEQHEEIFKQFGDAIAHKAKWEGQAAGFALAIQILHGVAERGTILDIHRCLNLLFVDLIAMKVASTLLSDIAEEAKLIFTEAGHQAICDAAIHCAGYLESGKNPAYLEKISPDMAILVRAIVDEGKS